MPLRPSRRYTSVEQRMLRTFSNFCVYFGVDFSERLQSDQDSSCARAPPNNIATRTEEFFKGRKTRPTASRVGVRSPPPSPIIERRKPQRLQALQVWSKSPVTQNCRPSRDSQHTPRVLSPRRCVCARWRESSEPGRQQEPRRRDQQRVPCCCAYTCSKTENGGAATKRYLGRTWRTR